MKMILYTTVGPLVKFSYRQLGILLSFHKQTGGTWPIA